MSALSLVEARALAMVEAGDRLGGRFPETLREFKFIVERQSTVELLEMMKAVAFRGWERSR